MLTVVCHLHDGVRACLRLDHWRIFGYCSTRSPAFGKGVLAPLRINLFLTAVLHVAEKLVLAGAAVMDNMVQLQRSKENGGKRDKPRTGNVVGQEKEGAQMSWGTLYAGDACILSRSPGGLQRMMMVICDCVRCIWASGLGGQDGKSCP